MVGVLAVGIVGVVDRIPFFDCCLTQSRFFELAFQRRTSEGAVTTHTGGSSATPPRWVRLTRSKKIVTSATSIDGVSWTDVGSDTLAIGTGPVLAGRAVTSHDDGIAATATLDNVSVGP